MIFQGGSGPPVPPSGSALVKIVNIFLSISVDLAHYEVFRTKVGNGSYPVGHKPMLKQACTSMQSHLFLHT